MPSTRSKKSNKSKKNSQQGGGLFGKFDGKKTKSNTSNPSNPPTARTDVNQNPNPNPVPSKKILTATTNNNPVPQKISIAIKEQIDTKITNLIQTLKDNKYEILIKIPDGKYIYPILQDFIKTFMVDLDPKKNNNYNRKEYKLIYWFIPVIKNIITKAQVIYYILDNKYKNQIIQDNFNLIDFINICLQKDDLSNYKKMFLMGLKDINEILNLNLDNKRISINISFVEGLIS